MRPPARTPHYLSHQASSPFAHATISHPLSLQPAHPSRYRPQVPPNGLVIYCGTILTIEGKEKKVAIDFEPFKPINTSLYLCDNKFHTEALKELLEVSSLHLFPSLIIRTDATARWHRYSQQTSDHRHTRHYQPSSPPSPRRATSGLDS